ncbi:MAG: hypothetical protein ACYSTL_07295, partial [Planctomycetota bacterium]
TKLYIRFVAAVLPFLILSGCQVHHSVYFASDMVNLTDGKPPAAEPEFFDTEANKLKCFAAANETISFQVVIDAGESGIHGLRIKASDLLSPDGKKIASANIRLFRMLPVKITSCPAWYMRLASEVPAKGSFYDLLIPASASRGAEPFDVAPQQRLALWVDLHVPRETLPGDYAGSLKLSSPDMPGPPTRIELKVYDFVLPDARPLAAVGAFDYRTLFKTFVRHRGEPYVPAHLDRRRPLIREGLTIIRQLMRLAHDHRLDLFDSAIHPAIKRDKFGKLRLDWEDYDAIVLPYLNGSAFEDRIGCAAWCVPFSETWPDPSNYGGDRSESYAKNTGELIGAIREHFTQTPEFSERAFIWAYRGEVSEQGYQRHARLARIIRAADSETPILSTLPPAPPPLTQWNIPEDFRTLTDVYAPRGEWLDPVEAKRLAEQVNPLAGVWLSPGTPPYVPSLGALADPADVRALPWFALKYKCAGLFLPDVLDWSGDVSVTRAESVGRIFYPGTIVGINEVFPSVRLKRLRRGLQDVAMLELLAQRQRKGIAKAFINSMVRYAGLFAVGDHYLDVLLGGWVKDGPTWVTARRLLAEEVQSVIHPDRISAEQLRAADLAWKQFDSKVRGVRIERVRSRVTGTGASGGETADTKRPSGLQAAISLELYNEYSRSVDVLVSLKDLPEGWKPLKTNQRISPILPATREVVELVAAGEHVAPTLDGKISLPVSIVVDHSQRTDLNVGAGFLVGGRIVAPLTIDGKLDDWPMRPGNTAGAFRLLGRTCQSEHKSEQVVQSAQTKAPGAT